MAVKVVLLRVCRALLDTAFLSLTYYFKLNYKLKILMQDGVSQPPAITSSCSFAQLKRLLLGCSSADLCPLQLPLLFSGKSLSLFD